MRSYRTSGFRRAFDGLPADIRTRATEAYARFRDNPDHPGLQFKRVHATELVYSARVSDQYRVLGVRDGDLIVWFWIGTHDDYALELRRL